MKRGNELTHDNAPVQCPFCERRIPIEKVLSDLRPDGFLRAYIVRPKDGSLKFLLSENKINPYELDIL